LLPPSEAGDAWKKGLASFLSFVIFGAVPVIVYAACRGAKFNDSALNVTFLICCIFSGLTMFALGVTKAHMSKQNKLQSGALMFFNGAIVAVSGYLLGLGFESLFPTSTS
jgi:VIT1/CCC1 family predicted Fe2+/Mn2+ transporter